MATGDKTMMYANVNVGVNRVLRNQNNENIPPRSNKGIRFRRGRSNNWPKMRLASLERERPPAGLVELCLRFRTRNPEKGVCSYLEGQYKREDII